MPSRRFLEIVSIVVNLKSLADEIKGLVYLKDSLFLVERVSLYIWGACETYLKRFGSRGCWTFKGFGDENIGIRVIKHVWSLRVI